MNPLARVAIQGFTFSQNWMDGIMRLRNLPHQKWHLSRMPNHKRSAEVISVSPQVRSK